MCCRHSGSLGLPSVILGCPISYQTRGSLYRVCKFFQTLPRAPPCRQVSPGLSRLRLHWWQSLTWLPVTIEVPISYAPQCQAPAWDSLLPPTPSALHTQAIPSVVWSVQRWRRHRRCLAAHYASPQPPRHFCWGDCFLPEDTVSSS